MKLSLICLIMLMGCSGVEQVENATAPITGACEVVVGVSCSYDDILHGNFDINAMNCHPKVLNWTGCKK